MTQLHLHACIGSRLDGIGESSDYAQKAKLYGHKNLGITDHGRMSGILEHQKQCIKNNIKPLLGIEMYLNNKLEHDDKVRTKNNHICLYAMNKIGYKNLLYLNYLSMQDDHYYYTNRITPKELLDNNEGIMVGTACLANPFVENDILFEKFCKVFANRFYVEVQLNELEEQHVVNDKMILLANKYGVPIVITGDVHYVEKEHHKLQTLSIAIRDKTTINKIKFELESKTLFYHSREDYLEFNKQYNYSNIEEWISNSDFIADKINFIIPEKIKTYLPKISNNDDSLLIEKAKIGLGDKIHIEEYRNRLKEELEILMRKGFSSYLLIFEDIFRYVKENNLLRGPGRGSSAGSLVLYSLGITTIDPIEHDLLFSRFMSDKRTPDVVYDYFNEGD